METSNHNSSSNTQHFEFFEDEEDLSSRVDLGDVQRHILTNMLALAGAASADDEEEESEVAVGDGYRLDRKILTFKVLVYDATAQNTVATVMKVGALRDCNVALHVGLLGQKREQVPDMPAVYLLSKHLHSPLTLYRRAHRGGHQEDR